MIIRQTGRSALTVCLGVLLVLSVLLAGSVNSVVAAASPKRTPSYSKVPIKDVSLIHVRHYRHTPIEYRRPDRLDQDSFNSRRISSGGSGLDEEEDRTVFHRQLPPYRPDQIWERNRAPQLEDEHHNGPPSSPRREEVIHHIEEPQSSSNFGTRTRSPPPQARSELPASFIESLNSNLDTEANRRRTLHNSRFPAPAAVAAGSIETSPQDGQPAFNTGITRSRERERPVQHFRSRPEDVTPTNSDESHVMHDSLAPASFLAIDQRDRRPHQPPQQNLRFPLTSAAADVEPAEISHSIERGQPRFENADIRRPVFDNARFPPVVESHERRYEELQPVDRQPEMMRQPVRNSRVRPTEGLPEHPRNFLESDDGRQPPGRQNARIPQQLPSLRDAQSTPLPAYEDSEEIGRGNFNPHIDERPPPRRENVNGRQRTRQNTPRPAQLPPRVIATTTTTTTTQPPPLPIEHDEAISIDYNQPEEEHVEHTTEAFQPMSSPPPPPPPPPPVSNAPVTGRKPRFGSSGRHRQPSPYSYEEEAAKKLEEVHAVRTTTERPARSRDEGNQRPGSRRFQPQPPVEETIIESPITEPPPLSTSPSPTPYVPPPKTPSPFRPRPAGRPPGRGGRRRQNRRQRTTSTSTTTSTTPPPDDDYETDYYEDDYDYDDYDKATTTTTTQRPKRRRGGGRRSSGRARRRTTPMPTTSSTPSTTTRTLSPNYKHRPDGRIIDWAGDPNFPFELRGSDLTEYPFFVNIPTDEITFKCDGRHDGYYANIQLRCQVSQVH